MRRVLLIALLIVALLTGCGKKQVKNTAVKLSRKAKDTVESYMQKGGTPNITVDGSRVVRTVKFAKPVQKEGYEVIGSKKVFSGKIQNGQIVSVRPAGEKSVDFAQVTGNMPIENPVNLTLTDVFGNIISIQLSKGDKVIVRNIGYGTAEVSLGNGTSIVIPETKENMAAVQSITSGT